MGNSIIISSIEEVDEGKADGPPLTCQTACGHVALVATDASAGRESPTPAAKISPLKKTLWPSGTLVILQGGLRVWAKSEVDPGLDQLSASQAETLAELSVLCPKGHC